MVYTFFSLHLESNRNIIRKWKLDNYILDFITDYDYSSIGVLANPTTKFKKYFNMPIGHNGWVEGQQSWTESYFSIDRDELIAHIQWYNTPWRGPNLTKDFTDILDFSFEIKYFLKRAGYRNLRVYLYFKNLNSTIYQAIIDSDYSWFYDNGSNVYNQLPSYLTSDSYNYFKLKRRDSIIEFSINDRVLYTGSTNAIDINSFTIGVYKYTSNPIDEVRVNRLYLTGYTNNHIIDTDTLVIDNYASTIASYLPAGSTQLELSGNIEYIDSGTLLYLGDVNSQVYEEVTVTGTLGVGVFGLNFFTTFDHDHLEKVTFSKNMYIFNNYRRKEPGGSIYKLNYTTGYVESTYDSDSYIDILACCFFQYSNTYLLGYVSITNFILLDIHNDMSLFEVMNIENVKVDQVSVIAITDVKVNNNSLYRIQNECTYYGNNYNWSNYNYQLTPINPFIDSTTIEAKPLVMNADGLSIIEVTTIAKDQYAEEIISIKTKFYDDDSVGHMTIWETYTGITGKATSYYRSGTTPREVLLSTEIIQE